MFHTKPRRPRHISRSISIWMQPISSEGEPCKVHFRLGLRRARPGKASRKPNPNTCGRAEHVMEQALPVAPSHHTQVWCKETTGFITHLARPCVFGLGFQLADPSEASKLACGFHDFPSLQTDLLGSGVTLRKRRLCATGVRQDGNGKAGRRTRLRAIAIARARTLAMKKRRIREKAVPAEPKAMTHGLKLRHKSPKRHSVMATRRYPKSKVVVTNLRREP